MVFIYYCPSCEKFHYAHLTTFTKISRQCSHCSDGLAINTGKSKIEYDAMDEAAKNEFKTSIKERFNRSNVESEIERLQKEKEEEKEVDIKDPLEKEWLDLTKETGIRHEIVQTYKKLGSTITITYRFYDNHVVQMFSSDKSIPTEVVWFLKDLTALKLFVDALNDVYLVFKLLTVSEELILKQGGFKYNGKMYQTNHYEIMKTIFDFLVNQIAKFKQPPM